MSNGTGRSPTVERIRDKIEFLRKEFVHGTQSWTSIYRNILHWAIIGIPIGIIAGLGAAVFLELWQLSTAFFLVRIVGISYPAPGMGAVSWSASFPRILLLPVTMGLGGLGAGLIAHFLAPEIAGHGTDETIRAFHRKEGKVRARVGPLKLIATALTLGTGGSGGREGPTSQIGGSFGSWWAERLHLPARERRIALAVGLGSGVGAIFKAPLGGALFSAEIFYMTDFEPEVIFPGIMASVVSYSIFGLFFGYNPLFTSPSGVGWMPLQLPLYAALGLLCAGVGVIFVKMFRGTQRAFAQLKWPIWLSAGTGGLAAGGLVLAIFFLAPWGGGFVALTSINVGYGFVQATMLGQTNIVSAVPLLLVILGMAVLLRMVATSLTVGSGGAAGLFGTSVVVGALLGSAVGVFFAWLFPSLVPVPDVAAFAVVGMMSFFGGISKAPLAVLVMVVEMVGNYTLLIPAMLAIFIAYAATGRTHIYSEQVENRLQSEAHREEVTRVAMHHVPVTSFLDKEPRSIDPSMSVSEALRIAEESAVGFLPLVREGHWYGFVESDDLGRVPMGERETTSALELARPLHAVISEEATVAEALYAMDRYHTDHAVVIGTGSRMQYRGVVHRRHMVQLTSASKVV